MTQIDKETFRKSVRGMVGDHLADKFCEGSLFFGDGKNFLSLTPLVKDNMIWIDGLVGEGLDAIRFLRQAALATNWQFCGFATTVDNRAVNSLARYFKAQRMALKGDCVEYCVPIGAR